jgi:hypothetical protein
MKLQIILIAFLFASLTAHADDGTVSEVNVNGSKVLVCNFNKVKKTETIPLSSLVDNYAMINFEDIDEALFNPWFTTVTDKYISVRQQNGRVFKLFDHSGKFLCNVGAIGQGPGEYSFALYDELIDDKNGLIYLVPMSGDKIYVYNTSGKFLKNISLPFKLHKPKLRLINGLLTVVHMPFKGDKLAFQIDAAGNVINALPAPQHLIVNNFDGELFNTRNTAEFDFAHTGSDTLYHYNVQENKLQPVFTMPTQSYKQYYELNDRYITNFFGKGLISTDKKNKNSSFIKVVNDYCGNMEMPVSVINLRNGWYVYNLEPAQLKEKIEKRLKESSCTEKDRQTLHKALSSLDEDANNVLFIGKLKTKTR